MLNSQVRKIALLGTAFQMLTGAAMLFVADGKDFLVQPIGAAFFALWNIWWVVVFSLSTKSVLHGGQILNISSMILFGGVLLAAVLGAPWEYLHFSEPLPRNGFFPWLGAGLMSLAIGLVMATLWQVNQVGATMAGSSTGCYMVRRGPFQYLRHPGYLSITLFLVGTALCLSSLIAWLATGVFIATCLLRISWEEKQLTLTFGKAFEEYRHQTPWAYLPGLY